MVFLPASSRASLPGGGIEAVVKETVDKRKKPETVTPHNNETTTKRLQKRGGHKGNGTEQFQPAAGCDHEAGGSRGDASGTDSNFPVRTGRL